MRITKVCTRTGDSGETGLVGGLRVAKDDPRIEAIGATDELSSCIGLARAELPRAIAEESPASRLLDRHLDYIQNQLFHLGASLATPPANDAEAAADFDESAAVYLERLIDAYNGSLPPLRDFVLPAGNTAVAALHVARCVARRAERRVVGLRRRAAVQKEIIVYLNRLSDLLFVTARWVARQTTTEVIWRHGLETPPVAVTE